MASVAESRRGPRYGSAADLAAYSGVSVKSIRRLVDAGKVRGLKLGRRLVIPYQDLDDHILSPEGPRSPTMPSTPALTTPPPRGLPRLQLDERGRAIPPTEAELREEGERVRLALDAMAAIPDDPPGSDEEFWRGVDAGRPERPLFRGMY